MIAALLLAAVAADALAAAQEAFARADYPRAEALALEAANPPAAGAALYLAGLARFRAGRAADALAALDGAAAANDPPPAGPLHYNRGACLNELARFSEAEGEFRLAALDPELAPAALVNAGFAALDAGSRERATALAEQARALRPGSAAGLLADLDAHLASEAAPEAGDAAASSYRAGLSAFDAGRFSEARAQFQRAAQLAPGEGRSLIMAGASAFRLGDRGAARTDLERALALPLDEADARVARDYLTSLSRDGRASGWQGTLRTGGGWDSDALQTGLVDMSESAASTATPSAMATAHLVVALREPLGERLWGRAAYTFDQFAYLASGTADRSLQLHDLTFSGELGLNAPLKLGASASFQLWLAGLSNFAGQQASGGLLTWAALDEGERLTTRLELGYTRKLGLTTYGYLTGNRADLALSQELRLGWLAIEAGNLLRLEDLGTTSQAPPRPPPRNQCPPMMCTALAIVPYGYLGDTLWAGARAALFERLDLSLSTGVEWRQYLSDSYLQLTFVNGAQPQALDSRRRTDLRWFGSAVATVRIAGPLSLSARYDVVVNRSNIESSSGDPGHNLDAGNRSYDKHTATLEAAVNF